MSDCAFPVIDMVATGSNIKYLMKKSGMKVSELQEYFGFEYPQAVYKWVKGQSVPSVDNLYALSKLFGVHMDDILVSNDQDVLFYFSFLP